MRTVAIVSIEELEGMHTGSLLERLHALQRCEERIDWFDMDPEEVEGITAIIFKDSPEWRAAHAEVKAVLATREHVPSKAERTEARREAARAAQGSAE